MKWTRLTLGLVACAMLALALSVPAVAQSAAATQGGLGQYIVGKNTYESAHGAFNPTAVNMTVLMIVRNEDGSLDSDAFDYGTCTVCAVRNHATDDSCFDSDADSQEERVMYEVISVPTKGKQFDRAMDNEPPLGIFFTVRKGEWGTAMDPKLFELRPVHVADVKTCVCDALADKSLDLDTFVNVPDIGACP